MFRLMIGTLALLFSIGTSWATGTSQHPKVTLKDQNGNPVLETGYPVSVRKSCGGCHHIDFIANGYHFQQGRLALLSSKVYRENYYNKSIDIKQKRLLTESLSGKVDGGMYGNLILCPHPTPLGPRYTKKPLEINLTTPEWCAHCGVCHVGGGPMEKDRTDHYLYQKSGEQIAAELKAGNIPGDYVVWSGKEKKFVPFEWKKYGLNNVAEPSCFLCHSTRTAYNRDCLLNYRIAILKHYFAGANTLGGGLAGSYDENTGKLIYDISLDVDPERPGIQINGNIIGKPRNEHCVQCHAGWTDDIDEDGKFTHKDVIIQFFDLKFLQPDTVKEAWLWSYNDRDLDANGVPKRIDIHKDKGLGCIDCHAPVGASSHKRPSHDFAKGNTGPMHRVRWHQLAGTASCRNCHDDPVAIHTPAFGPSSNAKLHMDKISCTLCHIGKKYSFEAKLIDETEPLYFAHYDRKSKRITVHDVFVGMPYLGGDPDKGSYEDLGLFPEREPGGTITWRYKPVNVVGLPYFVENSTGIFKVLPERYLLQVLKVDASLPTFYLTIGTPKRKGKRGYLNIQPNMGSIAQNKSLAEGSAILAYALPNYIDVNFNDQFDSEDVPINDDTSLNGNGKDGIPEINTLVEVKAAVQAFTRVIAKESGTSNVKVKLVTTFHPFSVSHNVRPKEEALRCVDCHGQKGTLSGYIFTTKATLYYPYDDAAVKAGYVELNFPRIISNQELAKAIEKRMIEEGFSGSQ